MGMKNFISAGSRPVFLRSFILVFSVFLVCILLYFLIYGKLVYSVYNDGALSRISAGSVSEQLVRDSTGNYFLPEAVSDSIAEVNAWAILISDKDGQVCWGVNVPDDVPDTFTFSGLADLYSMYYKDYPVLVSEHPDGMLILGYKGKEVVNVAVTQSVSTIKKVRVVTLTTLFMVIIFLLVLSLVLAARSWREVKTIMSGIETLSEGKSVCLKEKGEFAAIASAINRTSDRLKKYSEYRKRWIAGVSHDIRTPLTVILGRADQIGASDIKVQATRIRELITDLNMYSQLEHREEIPFESLKLVPFIREVAADFADGAQGLCSLSLDIDKDSEHASVKGNRHLLSRALNNLMYNSLKHNPSGCDINISVSVSRMKARIVVRDNGYEVPQNLIDSLNSKVMKDLPEENMLAGSGLGLYIVSEIVRQHGGTVRYSAVSPKGFCSEICLRIM